MQQYLDLLNDILDSGVHKNDRTGTGTISTFGRLVRYDLKDGKIPLITTKKMFYNNIVKELLWFISGSTDIKYLKDNNISIWDSWVDPATATYRPMTNDELKKALEAHYKKNGYETVEFVMMSNEGNHYTITDNKTYGQSNAVIKFEGTGLKRLYEAATNKLARVLASGSIGSGAYGAMWRNIEDTRYIDNHEEEKYRKLGFDVEYMFDKHGCRKSKSVATRRIDQIQNIVNLLRTSPDSRRIILHAFDNRMVDFCALPPCHSWLQVWTRELGIDERMKMCSIKIDEKLLGSDEGIETVNVILEERNVPKRALSLMLLMRSNDVPVGCPFNIAQYGVLAHMLAHIVGMVAEEFIYVGGDAHIYLNQVGQAEEQLQRTPYENAAKVILNPKIKEIDDFTFEDIKIVGYDGNHYPSIKYPVAV